MLVKEKTITINGKSEIEGQVVATMYCSIGENGVINSNTNIVNGVIYNQNKELVQSDIDEFTKFCRDEEASRASNSAINTLEK